MRKNKSSIKSSFVSSVVEKYRTHFSTTRNTLRSKRTEELFLNFCINFKLIFVSFLITYVGPGAADNKSICYFAPTVTTAYDKTIAAVRVGNDLCDQEVAYLSQRKKVITQAITRVQGSMPIQAPTVAVCCSGGGYRAMLFATGALLALEQSGLLDTATYVLGLSGSTWAIAPWISSGQSVQSFHDWIIKNLSLSFTALDLEDMEYIEKVLLLKYCADQSTGFVDVYGACLGNKLQTFFNASNNFVFLSNQATTINNGAFPMPIYTALDADTNATQQNMYEFSPYEVGGNWLGAYVPTWAFGRSFDQGSSTTFDVEQPLSTLLGTFGLAIGLSIEDAFNEVGITDSVQSEITQAIINEIFSHVGNDRPIYASYNNFVQGTSQQAIAPGDALHLADAGIYANLPYVPISGLRAQRTADIIIFVDASSDAPGTELALVQSYAKMFNLPFPVIDYSIIGTQAYTVFGLGDVSVPTVIYIPRIVDETSLSLHKNIMPDYYALLHGFDIDDCIANGECNTFNFIYSAKDANRVASLAYYNTLMASPDILKAIVSKCTF